jgi:hypothetical protein
MLVHELRNAEGVVQVFEVSSLIGRRACCKIAAAIPGVRVTKTYTPFVSQEVAFCEFELNGEQFLIKEPFQDNSRYWVGPKHNLPTGSLPLVLNHFACSKSGTRAVYAGAAVVLVMLMPLHTRSEHGRSTRPMPRCWWALEQQQWHVRGSEA